MVRPSERGFVHSIYGTNSQLGQRVESIAPESDASDLPMQAGESRQLTFSGARCGDYRSTRSYRAGTRCELHEGYRDVLVKPRAPHNSENLGVLGWRAAQLTTRTIYAGRVCAAPGRARSS